MLNRRFLNKITAFIKAENLLHHGAKQLVALSGGVDSVTLLLSLKQLGYDVEAAHCNFHLRGKESDRDEDFCRALCAENSVKLHVAHFDTITFASLHKISIEMAARRLRYAYFEQLLKDIKAETVSVAHHKDDTVETVLMNLIRGTGVHGLTGIAPRNGHVVRPLLCVFRNEIETVLTEANQSYVTDSTNLKDNVVRNKVRLDLIPMMRNINPSVSDSIAATAQRISDAAKVFDHAINEATNRIVLHRNDAAISISIKALQAEAAPEYVLFTILKQYSFTPAQTEMIFQSLASSPGKTFSSKTHQLLIDRSMIVIEPAEKLISRPLKIPEEGVYNYGKNIKIHIEKTDAVSSMFEKSPCVACLDASKVTFPLTLRPTTNGDRFTPFGMRGSKLVSNYLTDRKFNLFEKRRQLVIADASGRIIWLVSERPDESCRITEHTKTMLRLSVEK